MNDEVEVWSPVPPKYRTYIYAVGGTLGTAAAAFNLATDNKVAAIVALVSVVLTGGLGSAYRPTGPRV